MKKSIKTVLLAAIALMCAFAFAACGGDSSGNNNSNNNNNNNTEQSITAAEWDKAIDNTWAELTKEGANYKWDLDCVVAYQSGGGYSDCQTYYVDGNKEKREWLSDDDSLSEDEISGTEYTDYENIEVTWKEYKSAYQWHIVEPCVPIFSITD